MSNDSTLKKDGEKSSFTQEQMRELIRCSRDPLYFIEKYVKVVHPIKGTVPFKLYDYQRRLVEEYETYHHLISLLPRQSGKTETTGAYLLWNAIFKKDQNILIAANKFDHVTEILKRIKNIYLGLPKWLVPGVKADGWNAKSLKLSNGSTILGVTTTADSGRGKSISILYVDEFSFVQPNIAREFWASIRPTLATGGRCLITSTPNTDADEFAQIWRGAENVNDEDNLNPPGVGGNGFRAYKAYWYEHPERDDKWKQSELNSIGEERFRREYGCEFVSYDPTLLDSIFLSETINDYVKNPIHVEGQIKWFNTIKPEMTYVVGLDPAMGNGGDNAAIQVYQIPPRRHIEKIEQVAEWYCNKTDAPGQVKILYHILKTLDTGMRDKGVEGDLEIYWSFENNSIGDRVLGIIEATGEDKFPGTLVSETKRKGGVRARRGLATTHKTKIDACSMFKSMIEHKELLVYSKKLIRELKFFIEVGETFKAKQGETDDLIMATLMCIRILKYIQEWSDQTYEKFQDDVLFEGDIQNPMPTFIL